MAIENENLVLTGMTPQVLEIGTSTAFIVQNVSQRTLRVKVKDSIVEQGAIIKPLESFEFNYSIDIWVDDAKQNAVTTVYVIRN